LVSQPCNFALGTVQWGMPYGIANRSGQPTIAQVQEMLDMAREAGINTLDTARAYGDGERIIGELLEPAGYWRVVTKLSPDVANGAVSGSDAAKRVQGSIDASRKALRSERLDTVLLHRASHKQALNGAIWEALIASKSEGTVARLGVSAGTPEEAFAAIDDATVEVVQVASSLLDQRLARSGFFERARGASVEVFVRSVFLQGVAYLRPDGFPAHLEKLAPALRSVGKWAEARKMTVAEAFLLFARDVLDGTPVLGCESASQLEANLAAWSLPRLAEKDANELAGLVPELEEGLVNPAMWGS